MRTVAVLRIARGGSGDADRLETFEVPCRDHIHPAQRDQRLDHRAQRPPLQRLAYPPIRTRHATARLPCEKLDRTSLRQPPLPQDIVTFDAEQEIEALPDARLRLDTEVVGEAIVDEYAPGVAHERMNVTHPEIRAQPLAEYQ